MITPPFRNFPQIMLRFSDRYVVNRHASELIPTLTHHRRKERDRQCGFVVNSLEYVLSMYPAFKFQKAGGIKKWYTVLLFLISYKKSDGKYNNFLHNGHFRLISFNYGVRIFCSPCC